MAKIPSPVPQTESALLRFLDRIDQESSERTKDYRLSRWPRAIRTYRSGHPDPTDQAPIFHTNLVAPAIRRATALISEVKPIIEVRPRREGLKSTAKLLTSVIQALWDENNFQASLEEAVLISKILGSSFVACLYDPEANYGLGAITLQVLDPRQVGVDPLVRRAQDISRASWVWVDSVIPLHVARSLYPQVADQLKPSFPVVPWEREPAIGHDSSIRGPIGRILDNVRGSQARGSAAVPRITLRTYWITDPSTDDDGNPLYPSGRVIVRVKNEPIICNYSNGEPGQMNPYYDGCHPIEWYDSAFDLDEPWGRDQVDALRHLQLTINRLGNAVVKNALQQSIAIAVADQNALPSEAIDFLRNADFYVIEKMVGRAFERGQPTLSTSHLLEIIQFASALIGGIQGLSDGLSALGTQRGRAEVRTSSMLEGLQQASQVLIRADARRLEHFLERLGQKLISRVFQFMTQDRIMTYSGDQQEISEFTFERRELLKELIQLASKEVQFAERKEEGAREQEPNEESERSQFVGGLPDSLKPEIPQGNEITPERILGIIKGAWREFRFIVKPYSSLSSVRQSRSLQAFQLNQVGLLPSRMVLEELGYMNAKELSAEALREQLEKQALGMVQQPTGSRRRS